MIFEDMKNTAMKEAFLAKRRAAIASSAVETDKILRSHKIIPRRRCHLYCLESPGSFSCGNLVPNAFKASHKVTLLGQESGGGSCVIHPLCTAAGSRYQVSGYRRFSIMKNGSFCDVDRGAQPDYFIGDINRFYNRKELTEYINSLN